MTAEHFCAGRKSDEFSPVYSRADLLRILHITPRQLANWERAGLATSAESYSFSDMLEIKKIRDLCAMSVRPNVIRQSLDAMRKRAAGVEKPLLEAGAWSTNKHRVAFRHDGKLLEPIAGQFLMDFSEREKVLTSTPIPRSEPSPRESEVASWFARGIALEEDPTTQLDAIAAYHKVLEISRYTRQRISIWARSTTIARIFLSLRNITARR